MGFKAPGARANFRPLFPTDTAGDGKSRPNNVRDGSRQPNAKPTKKKKVRCKQCGFLADASRHNRGGGDLSGDGAGGAFTEHSSDSNVKEQAYRPGAGCPLCFSRNY